jgi:hypothetical protein
VDYFQRKFSDCKICRQYQKIEGFEDARLIEKLMDNLLDQQKGCRGGLEVLQWGAGGS